MSSYATRVRRKGTKKILHVFAFDDYFGKHEYGYEVEGLGVFTEKGFKTFFVEVGDDQTT